MDVEYRFRARFSFQGVWNMSERVSEFLCQKEEKHLEESLCAIFLWNQYSLVPSVLQEAQEHNTSFQLDSSVL